MSITVNFLNWSSTTVSYNNYPYTTSISLPPNQSASVTAYNSNYYYNIGRNGTTMSVNGSTWVGTGSVTVYPYNITSDGGTVNITFSDTTSGGGSTGVGSSSVVLWINNINAGFAEAVNMTYDPFDRITTNSQVNPARGTIYGNYGDDFRVGVSLNSGYELNYITVNGSQLTTNTTYISLYFNPGMTYQIDVYTSQVITSHTITYNANGGSGAPSSQTKTYGVSLTLSSTKPTRTGYTFTGWNTNSSGTGTSYSAGASYTANAAATLYAQWSINSYSLSYNANGGSGAPSSQTANYQGSWSVNTTTIPTRSGYIFKGWGESSNLIHPTYWREGSYTITVPASNKTLYAIWWPDFSWDDGETRTNANKFIEYLNQYYSNNTKSLPALNETNGILFKKDWYNNICYILWGTTQGKNYALINSTKIVSKTLMKALENKYKNYKGEEIK